VELQTLLDAGTHALSESGVSPLRTPATTFSEQIDWHQLHHLTQEHGMEPLLIRYLQQTSPESMPSEFAAELDRRLAAIQAENLAMVAELESLLELFESRDVPVLVYKGPVAACRVYENLSLRSYTDIDLLVPPDKEHVARAALQDRGYQHQTTNGPVFQAIFRRPTQQPIIDLHTSVIPEFFPFTLDFAELHDRRVVVDIGGTPVPTMSTGDAFLIHSIHGTKHHWFRIEWILATALICRQINDLATMFAQAEAMGCERMVLLGAVLARRLFSLPVPEPLAHRLNCHSRQSTVIEVACDEIIDWILYEEWANQNVKRTHIADFQLRSRLLSSPSDKSRFWIRALTNPRSEDIAWIDLPDSLSPLYRVLRPIRLLLDYRNALSKNR